jgi:hypothetical protein
MIEAELPFGSRTAERLMEIAGNDRLTNPTHVSLLPPHWGTLHALTKLDPDEFDEKLTDGTINPEMTRADAKSSKKEEREPDNVAAFFRWADAGPEKVDAADEQIGDIKKRIKDAALLIQQYARDRKRELSDRKSAERAAETGKEKSKRRQPRASDGAAHVEN